MSSPPSLFAVVVTFNRLATLKITLARLLEAKTEHLAGIIVVDNACTDGTESWLASLEDARLQVLRLPENCGGAGGFEAGMRLAGEADPDWMVLFDDDARPYPGALAAFHAVDRTGADAWAAAVYDPKGEICDMNRPSRNPFWHTDVWQWVLRGKGREAYHIPASAYEGMALSEIDVASFVGFFVSRAGRHLAGVSDGRLFLYGDDVLYSLTLRKAGGRILFDPSLRFEHDHASRAANSKRFTPLWKVYYYYRNLLFAYRSAAGHWFILVAPVMALKWLVIDFRHYHGARLRYLRLWGQALRDGVKGRTSTPFAQVKIWSGE
ncbi:MAG: glycosyltransferase [Pseudomonadota bacterium]